MPTNTLPIRQILLMLPVYIKSDAGINDNVVIELIKGFTDTHNVSSITACLHFPVLWNIVCQ